jgi:hypothetical protein
MGCGTKPKMCGIPHDLPPSTSQILYLLIVVYLSNKRKGKGPCDVWPSHYRLDFKVEYGGEVNISLFFNKTQ